MGALVWEGTPTLKVVHEESEPNITSGSSGSSLLDEIVRDGARPMLAAAVQAEVELVERPDESGGDQQAA